MTTTRKPTRQQVAVAEMLSSVNEFTSAQDLHARLRASGNSVGLATVYRSLQSMAADGAIDVLRTDDGEAVYRNCGTSHHHHIVCRECGKAIEVEGPAVEKWADAIAAEYAFADVSHQFEIFGVCPECQKLKTASA